MLQYFTLNLSLLFYFATHDKNIQGVSSTLVRDMIVLQVYSNVELTQDSLVIINFSIVRGLSKNRITAVR